MKTIAKRLVLALVLVFGIGAASQAFAGGPTQWGGQFGGYGGYNYTPNYNYNHNQNVNVNRNYNYNGNANYGYNRYYPVYRTYTPVYRPRHRVYYW